MVYKHRIWLCRYENGNRKTHFINKLALVPESF